MRLNSAFPVLARRRVLRQLSVSDVAPVNTTPPSITGAPIRGLPLTRVLGEWEGADSVTGEWVAADVPIVIDGSAEVAATLLMDAPFDLQPIAWRETATGGGVTVVVTSNVVQWAPEMTFSEFWHIDDLIPLLADGAFVSTWAGRNGMHTLTASGTSRPVLHHASPGGDAAHVEFDGVDDFMRADSAAIYFTIDESFSAFVSFEHVQNGVAKYIWCADSGSSAGWKGLFVSNDDYTVYLRSRSSTYLVGGPSNKVTAPAWALVTNEEGEPPSRPWDVSVYTNVDGGATASYQNNGNVGSSGQTFTQFVFGCQTRGTVRSFYRGKARSLGLRDRVLTANETAQLADWADTDWSA